METNAAIFAEQGDDLSAADPDLFARLIEDGSLAALLRDRTTGRRIVWATDTYASLGPGFGREDEIAPEVIAGRRAELAAMRLASRAERTRAHGEVFTPLSVCERMCDYAREVLRGEDWREYVAKTVLEITCGEAPFLVSRGGADGRLLPLAERVGVLDGKLALIGERTRDYREWRDWTLRAYRATYAYEFQGDNLLAARLNLLLTFADYCRARWRTDPAPEDRAALLEILSWNIWQMDGLTGTVPFRELKKESQASLFGGEASGDAGPCLIRDWQEGEIIPFISPAGGRR